MDSQNDAAAYRSLYALDHLKHQAIANISVIPVAKLTTDMSFRYEENLNIDGRFLTDAKLSYMFSDFTFFAQATNLFNVSYKEIGSVPMPGRWLSGGVKFNISEI
jgi:iron complex outermembrane receptor protein